MVMAAPLPASPGAPTSHRLLNHRQHRPFHSNSTPTASVTIRVTPMDDFLVSWVVLWGLFVTCVVVSGLKMHKEENRLLEQQADDLGRPDSLSSAHRTRAVFRRLLLLAMVARAALMPAQIWLDPIWWQFFCDTFPEMVFASAWTLLVSFFVQMVDIATGSGSGSPRKDTGPSIAIQATAYVVYLVLITTQLWNSVVTVLLYALLCCIYSALFGTVVFFLPRLLALLQPVWTFQLALRLCVFTAVCFGLFAAQIVRYAVLVVAPSKRVYWWVKYGAMELLPAAVFLVLLSLAQWGGRTDAGAGAVGQGGGYEKLNHQQHGRFPPPAASVGDDIEGGKQQQHQRSDSMGTAKRPELFLLSADTTRDRRYGAA